MHIVDAQGKTSLQILRIFFIETCDVWIQMLQYPGGPRKHFLQLKKHVFLIFLSREFQPSKIGDYYLNSLTSSEYNIIFIINLQANTGIPSTKAHPIVLFHNFWVSPSALKTADVEFAAVTIWGMDVCHPMLWGAYF